MLEPKRIIRNGIATIVFWNDGTKTIVKCAEDDEPDDYMAFCAAYCKKVFGSNSRLKRVIKNARNAKLKKENIPNIHKVFNTNSKLKVYPQPFPWGFKFLEPMQGCKNCEHVNTCPDCFTNVAVNCGNYNSAICNETPQILF